MLIIHEVELYIEKDFPAELLSVFPSLPRLPFRFRFCVQIPDSRFRILTFPYTVNIRPRKMCRKCFRKIASLAKDLHAFRDIYLRSKQIQEVSLTFVKSVSQFGKVLIESQMLIIHEVELYIEKDFPAELFSVFPSLPRLPFRFRFCVQIPDSRFRILTFPYTVNIRPRKMCRK